MITNGEVLEFVPGKISKCWITPFYRLRLKQKSLKMASFSLPNGRGISTFVSEETINHEKYETF